MGTIVLIVLIILFIAILAKMFIWTLESDVMPDIPDVDPAYPSDTLDRLQAAADSVAMARKEILKLYNQIPDATRLRLADRLLLAEDDIKLALHDLMGLASKVAAHGLIGGAQL